MTTRRNIGGRYVEVREKNTKAGHKGTIMKNWSSKQFKKDMPKNNNLTILSWVIVFLIFLLLIWFVIKYYFY